MTSWKTFVWHLVLAFLGTWLLTNFGHCAEGCAALESAEHHELRLACANSCPGGWTYDTANNTTCVCLEAK